MRLGGNIGLLQHLAASPRQIEAGELLALADALDLQRETLGDLVKLALEHQRAEGAAP